MSDPDGAFVAYASTSPLRAEAMRAAAERLTESGLAAVTWEHLRVEGHLLINDICAAIDARKALLADVSTLNENVLFEVGYALGKNKLLWIALDESDTMALKAWGDLALLATLGRINYTGDGEKLASKILAKSLSEGEPELLDALLVDARPRESNAVFAPGATVKTHAVTLLERYLERQSHLKILGSGDDLGLAPLQFYAQEIYRCSAAVFHLLGPDRLRASEYNARATLLAGYSHAIGLPTLMVAEFGYLAPLDFRDMLYVYKSSAKLQSKVAGWLSTLPKDPVSKRRLGRLPLDVELPIRTFGQYVAEYEAKELEEYFIDTNEYREILSDSSKVFIGRKGTGKSATMSQAIGELRRDKRNLVVPIKPSSYELSGLIDVLRRVENDSSMGYLLVHLWNYLIYSEIAIWTVRRAAESPAGVGGSAAISALEAEMDALKLDADADMSSRLEDIINSIVSDHNASKILQKEEIVRFLKVKHVARLSSSIRAALHGYERVAVIIDNLDKTWERGADYQLMAKFLLSLLHTSGQIEKEFAKSARDRLPVNLTLSIFLRTDIYDVMAAEARERDKIGALTIHWRDPDLLVRVLEERYVAKLGKTSASPDAVWRDVFTAEVSGVPTRDYFLWRALPRPRDIIYFANASLTTAINRRHHLVQDTDVHFGEVMYSKFALDALLVESEAQGWDMEEVLYEFAGLNSTLDESQLDAILGKFESSLDIRMWLLKVSFLGLETGEGEFEHIEGEIEARRKILVSQRLAERLGRQRRYRVHPAFRPHLDVRDDDLHSPGIQDVTLL